MTVLLTGLNNFLKERRETEGTRVICGRVQAVYALDALHLTQ